MVKYLAKVTGLYVTDQSWGNPKVFVEYLPSPRQRGARGARSPTWTVSWLRAPDRISE